MDSKRHFLTPQKRPNETSDVGRLQKRTPDSGGASSRDILSSSRRVYQLKVLLPNGMAVSVKIPEGEKLVTVDDLAKRVKVQHDRAIQEEKASSPRKNVQWNAELCFIDENDTVFTKSLSLTNLELNRVYNLRLDDGSKPAEIYENMWDLTPDTELLMELPEEYTFETALADLIDNSLQAVWSNDAKKRRLISVEVSDEKISIVDTGPGMDSMSIEKWGKMGASLHRAYKTQAIGGKPPYLKPAFGMFGYGGFVASMHLGRHTEVSSKTKSCKKVYMLRFQRDALLSSSGSKRTWRTYGGIRDPRKDELQLSAGGSFTRVDIFEPKMRSIDIRLLQCKLKDIYFPYIQCDELSKKGHTTTPIEFQVNGDDLAEIPGGEVAITNLNSCNGPEFVLQLHFKLNHDNATTASSPGARLFEEANARLRCVYLPAKEGKETICSILETLKEDGYEYKEDYGSFSHVSCRRLGRLLPEARWAWLPFMDFRQRKADRSQVLKRSCMRVKCFIETDAGFSPTPSKTNFAHQNPFTTALKNLGSRQPLETETGVEIEIRKDGKSLTLAQLDKQYQQWLVDMHEKYDEEIDCGVDEPVYIVNPINRKEHHIPNGVVRVHKVVKRKGKTWKSGQRIKILKGAYAGFHKTNVYATLEYILLDGIQGDAAGDAWIVCRAIDLSEEDGSLLESVDGNPKFELRQSKSLPINVIDSGKCVAVDESEWNNQLEKQYQKCPSSIEILNSSQCSELGIQSLLPDVPEVSAGDVSPSEIVAVVRPATYKSGSGSKHLDQKYVMRDKFEMLLTIKFSSNEKSKDEENIYSGRVTPSSRSDFHGLYVFRPRCKSHPLFQKAGIYTFMFAIRDSSCEKSVVKVRVKASREVHRWAIVEKNSHLNLTVGCSCKPIPVVMLDKFENQIPFLEEPILVVKICCGSGTRVQSNKPKSSLSRNTLTLVLQGLVIESSNLENIRPNYDATLKLYLHDGSQLVDSPIKVFPGPFERFTVESENFEKQLIPGHAVNELILELFDAYGNHVKENEEVQLSVDGFQFLERSNSLQKVDSRGCIDLGGLLTVTARYGRKVSLSLCSNKKVISKEWEIEKRQLKIASMIPESCFAGSQLENLEFVVVNSKGDVDTNFHDEDIIGKSHTLVIKSQSTDIDESIKYVFREGRCVVRAVPIPPREGDCSFVVAHSRYSEIQLTVKVRVELPPEMELLNIRDATPETYTSSLPEFEKDLGNEIVAYGLRIGEHEERIKSLESQQTAIESELFKLEGIRDRILCIGTHGSPGKNEIKECIKRQTDSAAALVMELLEKMPHQKRHDMMGNIIGIVALIGKSPTLELSRIFAEYLGDQMLALVCKSSKDLHLLEKYEKNGKLNHKHRLHMAAAQLGRSINGRYLVLCLEEIRPCKTDKDGKLLLPDPKLPDGSTPIGFLGYAVNMIQVDADHLSTKTDSGCGLLETLFYRLFGDLQVYESRVDMNRAISCIKDGAVSLDGGILRGNGAVSLGCSEPDVIFPVAAASDPPERDMQELKRYSELKLKLTETMTELSRENKSHGKILKKFKKRHDLYAKYSTCNPFLTDGTLVSPISSLEEKPVIPQQCSYKTAGDAHPRNSLFDSSYSGL